MKKALKIIVFAAALCGSATLFAACGDGEEKPDPSSFSALTGNFDYSEQLACTVNQSAADRTTLTSTVYPAVQDGALVDYVINARLKLVRDYTYTYTYTIDLRNSGWADAAVTVEAEFTGTYTYLPRAEAGEGQYEVSLSAPADGTFSVTGANMYSYMSGSGLNKWTQHETPDLVLDISAGLDSLAAQGYDISDYCKAKTVNVDTAEKQLSGDSLFFADILDFTAPYNTYQ